MPEAFLRGNKTPKTDGFGYSVSISGDTLAVGAHNDSSDAVGIDGDPTNANAFLSGAVYVFDRVGEEWSQSAYLKASNAEAGDFFGWAVALDGDTLAVTARVEDGSTEAPFAPGDNSLEASGALYVFARADGGWQETARLKAEGGDAKDNLGYAVAIEGALIAVTAIVEAGGVGGFGGAPTDDSLPKSGALYAFTRTDTSWSQLAYIKAAHPDAEDGLGVVTAISGERIAVSATGEDGSSTGIDGDDLDNGANGSGAVYLMR